MLVSQRYQYQNKLPTYSEEDKIQFTKNVRQWHHKFSYRLFNLEELNSAFLTENEKFITLKDRLHGFNKILQQCMKSKTYLPDLPQRFSFYSRIMQLLREALMIGSQEVQSDFMDRIYDWFHTEQVIYDPQYENKSYSFMKQQQKLSEHTPAPDQKPDPNNTSLLDYTQAPTNDDTRLQIEPDNADLSMPRMQIQQELKDYNSKARTHHKLFDPPIQRLTQYRRRQFNSLVNSVPTQAAQPPQSVFPANLQSQAQKTETRTQFMEEVELPPKEISESESDQSSKKPVFSMVPKVKLFTSERPDAEKRDLNKSFELKQNFQFYQPSNSEIELSLQQRWAVNRSKELQQAKEDEEMVSQIKMWSKYKSRVEKEIDRKLDSTCYGSRYTQCDFKKEDSAPNTAQDQRTVYLTQLPNIIPPTRPNTNLDISNLEQKIAQQKVNMAKTNYKNLLNLSHQDPPPSYDEYPNSLSIYANKVRSNSMHNKFSQLLQRNSPARVNESQLAEVIEIKHRMAKYKIPIPMSKLITGIMIPNVDISDCDKLPEPGQQLLVNPYEQKKGAKKGKKKRK